MDLRGARILSSCNEASNKQEQNMSVNIKVEDKMPQQTVQPTIQQIIHQPLSSGPHSIKQTIEQSPYGHSEGPRIEEARQLSQQAFVPTEGQGSIQQTITQPQTQRAYAQPEGPVYVHPVAQPVYVHPSTYSQSRPVNFTTPEQQLATTTTTATTTMPTERGSLTPPPEILTYPSIAMPMHNSTPTGVLSRDFNIEKDMQIQDLETKNKFLTLMLTVYQKNPLYINNYLVC